MKYEIFVVIITYILALSLCSMLEHYYVSNKTIDEHLFNVALAFLFFWFVSLLIHVNNCIEYTLVYILFTFMPFVSCIIMIKDSSVITISEDLRNISNIGIATTCMGIFSICYDLYYKKNDYSMKSSSIRDNYLEGKLY